MKAIVWHGEQSYKLENVPEPEPGPAQVVVEIQVAAICGSDLHLPDFGALPPIIPGHEAAGIVVETGADASGVGTGDRVTVNPVQTCGSCYCCTNGIEHLCLNTRHLGSGGVAGTWAERVAVDACNAHAIPENVSFTAAALTEPAAVCYESFQRAGLRSGDTVLVLGDGPFGFLHVQMAKALGAGKVICAGHYDRRLTRIQETTAALVCNTHFEDLDGMIAKNVPAQGVDIVVEATGSGAVPALGLRALRPRGTFIVFSYIWKPEALDMGLIHMKELNVLGACRSQNAFDPCLELMAGKHIDTGYLVDLSMPMDEYSRALVKLEKEKSSYFKIALIPGD